MKTLTAVDSDPVSAVLLGQLDSVGSELDLTQSDVAVLVVLHVLLGVEGAVVGHLGLVVVGERVHAVDAVLLDVVDAHAGDAVVGFVESFDDVAEGGALGVDGVDSGVHRLGGRRGLLGSELERSRRHL